MELNVVNNSFFVLLQAGLWNWVPDHTGFPLSPQVWNQVYRLACKHTVEVIIYDGITRLPNHCLPPKELLLRWVVRVDTIEERNRQMEKLTGEIYELFDDNHILALLMKGQGIAACYEEPSHRISGDIDVYFPDKKNFDMAQELIAKKGIAITKQAKFSISYCMRGFFVEHHTRLLDIDNPFRIPYLRRLLQQEEKNVIYLTLDNRTIPCPSPLLTHLIVNAHILKHLLTSGVGIRQLCDSARVCYVYHDRIEAESLEKIYRKLGIYRWIQLLNGLLVNYLGMSESCLPFPLTAQRKAVNRMMKDILQSGNFGLYGGPLSKSSDVPRTKQRKVTHWMERLIRYATYVRYAPAEASWNPILVVYSHIRNRLKR